MNMHGQQTTKIVGVVVLLFFVALFLTAYSARVPAVARIGKSAFQSVAAPLYSIGGSALRQVRDLIASYGALVTAREQNTSLQQRVVVLQSENSALLELRYENERLRRLVQLVEKHELRGVAAEVIAYDPSNWTQLLTINRGARSGIEPEMAVVESSGVVGQVIAVAQNSATVLLLTDPRSGIDGLIQDSRVRGIVRGTGSAVADWDFVLTDVELKIGDRIVTSGLDGIYPKGLVLGIVTKVGAVGGGKLFRQIEVTPIVDFGRLETVYVLTGDGESVMTKPDLESSGGA